ncbi:MAG: hypothetical protein ACHP9T_04125 [Caulobacterales bacterium]|jgi:DMSO/TMAO reductase YedYZ molybdopterin-dependent catalytic subunit
MKSALLAPVGLTLSLVLLAACQKPASQTATDAGAATANAAANTADAASNAAQDTTNASASAAAPGGVVSPPQANGAINTDANKTSTDAAAGSNSFTEGQAKGHIENAGYTDVTNLMKTPDGMWTASAKKGGKTMSVAVDFKGAVTAK